CRINFRICIKLVIKSRILKRILGNSFHSRKNNLSLIFHTDIRKTLDIVKRRSVTLRHSWTQGKRNFRNGRTYTVRKPCQIRLKDLDYIHKYPLSKVSL